MTSQYLFTAEEFDRYSVFQQNFLDHLKAKDEELGDASTHNRTVDEVGLETVTQLIVSLGSQDLRNQNIHVDSKPETSKLCKTNVWSDTAKKTEAVTENVRGTPAPFFTMMIPYPRESYFTKDQHHKYLELYSKYSKLGHQLSLAQTQEVNMFKELQVKFAQEQEDFMHYSKFLAENNREFYENLHPQAAKYIDALMEHQRQRVSKYSRYYIHHDVIPMPSIHTQFKSEVPFYLEQTLLQLGEVPRILLPNMESKPLPSLPLNNNKIRKRYPPDKPDHDQKDAKFYQKQVCSEDQNAANLASKYQTDVIISSSGLQCLTGNMPPAYERQWQLPVTIKHIHDASGQERKLIIIDKPFTPLNPHPRAKNNWYYKFALKQSVVRPKDSKILRFTNIHKDEDIHASHNQDNNQEIIDGKGITIDNDMEDLFDTMDEGALETFGTDHISMQNKDNVLIKKEQQQCNNESRTEAINTIEPVEDSLCKIMEKKEIQTMECVQDSDQTLIDQCNTIKVSGSHHKENMTTDITGGNNAPLVSEKKLPDKNITHKNVHEIEIADDKKDVARSTVQVENKKNQSPLTNELGSMEQTDIMDSSLESEQGLTIDMQCQPDEDALMIDLPNTSSENIGDPMSPPMSPEGITSPPHSSPSDSKEKPVKVIPLERFYGSSDSPQGINEQNVNNVNQQTENNASHVESSSEVPDDKSFQNDKSPADELQSFCVRRSLRSRKSDSSDGLSPTFSKKKSQGKRKSSETTPVPVPNKRLTRRQSRNPQENRSFDSDPKDNSEHVEDTSEEEATSSISAANDENKAMVYSDAEVKEPLVKKESLTEESNQSGEVHEESVMQQKDGFTPPNKTKKDTQRKVCEKEEKFSMFDHILKQQSEMLGRSKEEQIHPVQLPQQQLPSGTHTTTDTNPHTPVEDSSNYLQPEEHNVTYSIWRLGNFKLLVRCSIQGQETNKKGKSEFIHLMPKAEYQSQFGVEQLTTNEIANAWAVTIIRPACKLIRARINCHNGNLMLFEKIEQNELIPSRSSFRPHVALHILHDIIGKLHSLKTGLYLVSHTPGSPHINIKRNVTNKRGSYDLHMAYTKTGTDRSSGSQDVIPWVPLDPTIMLPWHFYTGRVPATFEPKGSGKVVQQQKKKKKKGKGKKFKQKASQKTSKEKQESSQSVSNPVSSSTVTFKQFVPSSTNKDLLL